MPEVDVGSRLKAIADRYNAAQGPDDLEAVLSDLEALRPEMDGDQLMSARLIEGSSYHRLGRLPEARATLAGLLDTEGSAAAPAHVLGSAGLFLSNVLRDMGRHAEAAEQLVRAAERFRQVGQTLSEANVFLTLGFTWQEQGDLDQAIEAFGSARELVEDEEVTHLRLQTLFALGHAHYLRGDVVDAIRVEEDALEVAQRLGDPEAQSQLIHNLAQFTFQEQDFRRAIKYLSLRLRAAETAGDRQDQLLCLAYLGASYAGTGASRSALRAFDRAAELLEEGQGRDPTVSSLIQVSRLQVLVDLKRYDDCLATTGELRALLQRFGGDTAQLDQIEARVARETGSPLTIDCAHRPIGVGLPGPADTTHRHPQPEINLTDPRFVTSELSESDRSRFEALEEELGRDYMQTRHQPSARAGTPGTFQMPLKLEYTDDVRAFEIKWSAYKKEREDAERLAMIQSAWEGVKDRIRFEEGEFAGDKAELLAYVQALAEVAAGYASVGDEEGVRRVALHASDFLEVQTDDPMVAAVLWAVRARLLHASRLVAPRPAQELLELEIERCLQREREVFELLSEPAREAALSALGVETWYGIARDVLGLMGYRHLAEIVGELADRLDPLDRMRHGIAVGFAVDPQRGTDLLDALIEEVRESAPDARVELAADFETARATLRFRTTCPDWEACRTHFGPFAPYIHAEVRSWDEAVFSEAPSMPTTGIASPHVRAFIDGNLAVLRSDLGPEYIATVMHELHHGMFRSGRHLRTDDDRWRAARRDVPITSASTFLHLLEEEDAVDPSVAALIEEGVRHAESDPGAAAGHVGNALRYFDDLAMQETPASYPCAAILVGIAFGLYGRGRSEEVSSYLGHLTLMDHGAAFEFGKRRAGLRL